ncbi:MAG TPA: trypsin-like peptidase domain-containing protein [Candidatus Dormibacteraeota bacterium]|nr:trypsin-like peptidase domain-containing protein [Candidatus Dormibacteraeota bacterium]
MLHAAAGTLWSMQNGLRILPKLNPLQLLAAALLVGLAACTVPITTKPQAKVNVNSGPVTTNNTSPAVAADPGVLSLETQFEKVVAQDQPSVVQIETAAGLGSGVVFDGLGDIVTNNHVVENYGGVLIVTDFSGHTYSNQKTASNVVLLGTYPADDLAVIRVANSSLQQATFADSSQVKVGQLALALGNPLGLQSSVTEGIVSATGRTESEGATDPFGNSTGNRLTSLIQTSAAINPGNSGGALVDINGDVIGIPTLAAGDPNSSGQAPGIGFAIDSNTAVLIAKQLIANGKVTNTGQAYLGVTTEQITDGAGVRVDSVVAGGPADSAGVKVGDLIVTLSGKATPTEDDLVGALAASKPGDKVQVGLRHSDGSSSTVTVTLGTKPPQA